MSNENSLTNKEYYCCDWINSGLHFQPTRLGFCCYGDQSIGDHPTIVENYSGGLIDDEITQKIQDFKKNFQKGEIPHGCQKCSLLEKRAWDGLDEEYFDHFMIGHSHKCNSRCIYCCTNEVPEHLLNLRYDVYSVIKDLFERGKIKASNRALVTFLGGEPTIFPEFEDLVHIFLEHDFQQIKVHSSGIICSKAVLKGLEAGAVSIVISPDSGTREMFKKIKRVDCFDKVWANTKSYKTAAKEDRLVEVKYIIMPDVNDDKAEIDLWFDKIVECGVKYIACDVEQNWFYSCKGEYPQRMYDLVDYFKKKADELSLTLELYTAASRMTEQR